jgi:hypothetical protein
VLDGVAVLVIFYILQHNGMETIKLTACQAKSINAYKCHYNYHGFNKLVVLDGVAVLVIFDIIIIILKIFREYN